MAGWISQRALLLCYAELWGNSGIRIDLSIWVLASWLWFLKGAVRGKLAEAPYWRHLELAEVVQIFQVFLRKYKAAFQIKDKHWLKKTINMKSLFSFPVMFSELQKFAKSKASPLFTSCLTPPREAPLR